MISIQHAQQDGSASSAGNPAAISVKKTEMRPRVIHSQAYVSTVRQATSFDQCSCKKCTLLTFYGVQSPVT